MIKIQIITTEGCHNCEKAKELFKKLQPQHPTMQIEEIPATTPEGMELVSKFGIFASPGIIVNDELFSTGGLDENDFIEKLDSLK